MNEETLQEAEPMTRARVKPSVCENVPGEVVTPRNEHLRCNFVIELGKKLREAVFSQPRAHFCRSGKNPARRLAFHASSPVLP